MQNFFSGASNEIDTSFIMQDSLTVSHNVRVTEAVYSVFK